MRVVYQVLEYILDFSGIFMIPLGDTVKGFKRGPAKDAMFALREEGEEMAFS